LDTVITEFQCQGLELDLPIVCWGDDFWWEESARKMRETRAQALVRDPFRLWTNAYRALLTRGREGLVVVVPRSPTRESTWQGKPRSGRPGRRILERLPSSRRGSAPRYPVRDVVASDS
ncbi:MAG: DNA/RNA helicase domain-containing protein, partial [Thermoanaerobaculia bacterium]